MRYENDGMVLWYGTPDAPAPADAISVADETNRAIVTITSAVQPPGGSNSVYVRYSINHGPPQITAAAFLRHDVYQKAQYFEARLPPLQPGDTVDYTVVCRCPGRQVPSPQETAKFLSSLCIRAATQNPMLEPARNAVRNDAAVTGATPGHSTISMLPVAMTASDKVPEQAPAESELRNKSGAAGVVDQLMRGRPEPVEPPSPGLAGSEALVPVVAPPNGEQPPDKQSSRNLVSSDPKFQARARGAVSTTRLRSILETSPSFVGTGSPNRFAAVHGSRARQEQGFSTSLTSVNPALVKRALAVNPHFNPARATVESLDLRQFSQSDQTEVRTSIEKLQREIKAYPDFDYKAALAALPAGATQIVNPVRVGISQFLSNAPDFEFRGAKIDKYIAEHPRSLEGVNEPALVVAQLKRMRRVFQVTPDANAINALMSRGFHSASQIASVPAEVFVSRYAADFENDQQAKTIYAAASSISAAVANIAFNAKTRTRGPLPSAIGGWPPPALKIAEADLDTLFNESDFCDCVDCQSVLSPAAYFVDLLHNFLEKAPANILVPVFAYLVERRPDLVFIRLDCENTNTPIPYLDLVNEALEACVVFKTTLPPQPNDTSPDATADELSVNPENTNPDAYASLQAAVYPATLPFNRSLETARAYLQSLGTTRHELMSVFQSNGDPSEITIACEYLGISSEERAILSTADLNGLPVVDPHPLKDYYGDISFTLYEFMTEVRNFLRFSDLQFSELLDLLKTRFVNPEDLDPSKRLLVLTNKECSLASAYVGGPIIQNLDSDEPLDRIHRFLRLWRKLGWEMLDLDRCMHALGASSIDDSLLVKLSILKRIMERLKLPLVPLLPFWSKIDAYRYDTSPDPYTALFQNKAVTNPIDPCFQLASPPSPQEIVGQPGCELQISAHLPAIQAALRLRTSDLITLVAAVLPNDSLTLENLSVLYRHALLARALRLAVLDLLSLKALSGTDPFATPQSTLTFLDLVDAVGKSGFLVPQLNYLYRDISPPTGGVAPTWKTFAALLGNLQNGLAQIDADNAVIADPTGDLARKKLMTLYSAGTVDQIVALIQGVSVWSTPLATMPVLTVPDELKAKLVFVTASQTLQFTGNMTDSERNALVLGQPASFQTAVPTLWQQPRDFIDATLVNFPRSPTTGEAPPFLDATDVKDHLLDPARSAAEKFALVLGPLLHYLADTLSRDLVTQTLGTAFSADLSLARLLLDRILVSRLDPAKHAMDDFLAANGLGTRFFADKSLSGTALIRADPNIDYNWGAGSPDPSLSHASFGARWIGLLKAQSTEVYSFFVRANDGVRLWIDDQLLIDDWHDQAVTERGSTLPLQAGQIYLITLEYYQATALVPEVHLSWSSASLAKSIVPSTALFPLDHWRLFHKAALLVVTFKLSTTELDYLSEHGADFDGFDVNQLPLDPSAFDPKVFKTWHRIRRVTELRRRFISPPTAVTETFSAPSKMEAIAKLTAGTGWDLDQLTWLSGPSGLDLSDVDFHNEIKLLSLADCFDLMKRTGMSAARLRNWAIADMSAATAPEIATEIRKAVKAKYDDSSWITVGKALNDPLREKSRDALMSYLLAHPNLVKPGDTDPLNPTLKTADDLYEYLLLDVQMDACMMTSRIKQAISTVQLFVQRCLLGLEQPDISPAALSSEHWDKWMKHYRVWEASRKIFLYPENWIEPQLRDDKTPFFQELETDLLKNELTAENVEAAYLRYLHKLEDIARPQILGVYVENASDPGSQATNQIIHVVGRTRTTPQTYYYRRQVNGARWRAWERVTADIEGDHIIPVAWGRRIYLFWAIFTEKAQPTQPSSGKPPNKYWEIKIAYSEYRQGRWTPKQVINQVISIKLVEGIGTTTRANFGIRAMPSGGTVLVQIFVIATIGAGLGGALVRELVAEMPFRVCDRVEADFASKNHSTEWVPIDDALPPELVDDYAILVPPGAAGSTGTDDLTLRYTSWMYGTAGPLELATGDYGDNPDPKPPNRSLTPIFGYLPSRFNMLVPHQFIQFVQQGPFFLEIPNDYFGVQNYFAMPALDGSALTVRFWNHSHQFVCDFLTILYQSGIDGLLSLQTQQWTGGPYRQLIFESYQPTSAVAPPHPENVVEFASDAAYSIYNWEIFFHAPFLIACKLSQDQRFEEAQRWFHYIFNPTSSSDEQPPQRYWNFLPFHDSDPQASIQDLLLALDDPSNPDYARIRDQLLEWEDDPFNPHLIARLRPAAYQKAVVMKYLDNLIAWGDQLFSQDTIETINEATQLYILAAKLLGPRPTALPRITKLPALTYSQLGAIDDFANALEDALQFRDPPARRGAVNSGTTAALGTNLLQYFCVPPNPKLLAYWDTVADRLFKIRHCMNIEGVMRQLPLFEPPIDPALLVQAAAKGVDIASVLSDLNAPVPYYRFGTMLRKALELCADLKSLGSALLSALEKADAEELAALRASQETTILNLVKEVKKNQLAEAQRVREGLDKTWELTDHRRRFYADQLVENGSGITGHEQEQQKQLDEAQDWQAAAQIVEVQSGGGYQAPDWTIGSDGPSPVMTFTYGGKNIGAGLHAAGNVLSYIASVHTYWANQAGTQAVWERRNRDYKLQMETAMKELEQIDKQKLAADIRIDIANQEITNHDKQIENAQAIENFLRSKYTNVDLYSWMISEVSAIYFQCYQVAYDLGKRAERCYRFERGLTDSNFIQFGYWDSLKKGLLSGERLYLGLKQMERAYLEQNQREYEITKHVSLQLFDPMELMALKQAGQCEVVLPEALFDADFPGHYMRRIKSVSVTLPCVVGPYTSINCTLTLLSNKTRINSVVGADYRESTDQPDDRFVANFAAMQSIATSHAQNDVGLFELNFRDERYLPFEGSGVISRWRIELPPDTNSFDRNTLTDVVLHLRYTAREGGELLRTAAKSAFNQAIADADSAPLMRLVSSRHEFPNEWFRFLRPADQNATRQTMTLDLSMDRFPFLFRGRSLTTSKVDVFLTFTDNHMNDVYRSGQKLPLTLTRSGDAGTTAVLDSQLASFGGTPHRQIDLGFSPPTTLAVSIEEDDVKKLAPELREQVPPTDSGHTRLRADAIDDMLYVFHYSVS